ncbi:hypothetical protein FRA_40c09270 [Francisella sp. W12-1067]|nr:hypothetical protein FRA_40c09270 [Francisella sp. W12-1067]
MSINNSDMVVHIIHGDHISTKSLANLSPDDYIQSQIDTIKSYVNTLVQYKTGQRHLVVCPEYFLTYKDREHPGSTKEEYKKYLTRLSNIPPYVVLVPGTCIRKKSINSTYDDLLDLHTSLAQKKDKNNDTISQQIKDVERKLYSHKPRLVNKYPQLNSLANYRYQVYKKAFEDKKDNFQDTYVVSEVSSLDTTNFIKNEYSKFGVNNIKQMNFVFNTLNVIYNNKNVYKYNKRSFWNEKKSQADSIYMPFNFNYNHILWVDKINFSFEICYDHKLKIRYNDIKNNQAKPSDYHIILSDTISTYLDTYLAPYLVHSSTDKRNSGLFVWNNSSYVKHYPCSYASISNNITSTQYKVNIHYSYSYTDKQNLNNNNNVNLLFSALNNNDANAVTNYIKQILSVNLSHWEKEKILAAKDSAGTPGLYMALQEGHTETVKAYIEGIRNIPMINKDILLAAKSNDGTPGLYMALQDGYAEVVKVYIEGIKNISLIDKDILLAAKRSDGIPGLFMALQEGHTETVKAYIEGIKNIRGINKDILLAAKNNDGIPGLFMALQEGHIETAKAYTKGIENIPGINKDMLLAAKHSDMLYLSDVMLKFD